jgi:hypothetical protein
MEPLKIYTGPRQQLEFVCGRETMPLQEFQILGVLTKNAGRQGLTQPVKNSNQFSQQTRANEGRTQARNVVNSRNT